MEPEGNEPVTAPAIELLKATPGLAIRPDPDGLRATLVAAEGLDELVVAEAAAALKSDVQTRDSVVKGIQRWRSIMAQLRAEHGRFIEEGSAHGGPFLPPGWYVAMHADLLVVAVGKPGLIRAEHVKPGAVVIDVGINSVKAADGSRQLVGDVAFDEVRNIAGVITPVPGGVGPVTVAILLRNATEAARKQRCVPRRLET